MLILWFSLSSSLTHLHPKALTHTHPEALTHTHPKALTHTHPEALICRCELISALKDLEHAHIIGRAQSHQLQQTKKELAAQSKQLNHLQKEILILRQQPKVTLGQSSSTTTQNRSAGSKLETKTIVPYVTVNGVRVVDGAALVNDNGNLQSGGAGSAPTCQFTIEREFDRTGNLQSVKFNGDEIRFQPVVVSVKKQPHVIVGEASHCSRSRTVRSP